MAAAPRRETRGKEAHGTQIKVPSKEEVGRGQAGKRQDGDLHPVHVCAGLVLGTVGKAKLCPYSTFAFVGSDSGCI